MKTSFLKDFPDPTYKLTSQEGSQVGQLLIKQGREREEEADCKGGSIKLVRRTAARRRGAIVHCQHGGGGGGGG